MTSEERAYLALLADSPRLAGIRDDIAARMLAEGLIRRVEHGYAITEEGRRALAQGSSLLRDS